MDLNKAPFRELALEWAYQFLENPSHEKKNGLQISSGIDILVIERKGVDSLNNRFKHFFIKQKSDTAVIIQCLFETIDESVEEDWKFPLLFDESQDIARAFNAACTPDFFLYDKSARLVYRGQMDGSRPKNDVPNDAKDLRTAMDALIAGRKINLDQRPSLGCNIKWKEYE